MMGVFVKVYVVTHILVLGRQFSVIKDWSSISPFPIPFPFPGPPTDDNQLYHYPALQSPINIETKKATDVVLPDLVYHDMISKDVLMDIHNDGYTVELTIAKDSVRRPFITGGPLIDAYEFDNLHIHWGAKDFLGGEHTINDRRFAIEGHCVHFNRRYGTIEQAMMEPDGLAVIAFFGEAGDVDNPKLEPLIDILPNITFPETSVILTAEESLGWFADVGAPKGYYTYPGSLTTPPYSENVAWIVYPKPMEVSSRQVEAFRNLLSSNLTALRANVRPLQPLNGRPVLFAY